MPHIELERAIEAAFQLGHPERYRILRACALSPESPKTLASDAHPLGTVAYHFRVLAEKDLIEILTHRSVRGARQTFYIATPRGKLLLRGMV